MAERFPRTRLLSRPRQLAEALYGTSSSAEIWPAVRKLLPARGVPLFDEEQIEGAFAVAMEGPADRELPGDLRDALGSVLIDWDMPAYAAQRGERETEPGLLMSTVTLCCWGKASDSNTGGPLRSILGFAQARRPGGVIGRAVSTVTRELLNLSSTCYGLEAALLSHLGVLLATGSSFLAAVDECREPVDRNAAEDGGSLFPMRKELVEREFGEMARRYAFLHWHPGVGEELAAIWRAWQILFGLQSDVDGEGEAVCGGRVAIPAWGGSGPCPWDVWSELHAAAMAGGADDVRRLLDGGADTEARDGVGGTPLHVACMEGHRAIAEALLSHGADIGAVNQLCMSPLHEAAQSGHADCVWLLVSRGADPDARMQLGFTALHRAAARGHVEAAEALLQAGADVSAVNSGGLDAHYFARIPGETGRRAATEELLGLLQRFGKRR